MNIVEVISIVAGILTTSAFVPQALKIIRTKETHGISIIMYIVMCSGLFLWMIYGLITLQIPLILANAVTLILSLIILVLKIKYK